MNAKLVLESILELKGLNQSKLAKKAGVSRQNINNILNSKYAPRLDTMASVLDKLGYKLCAAPKGVVLPPYTYTLSENNQAAAPKAKRICGMCNREILKDEYCAPYHNRLLCQECINKKFAEMIEAQQE